MASPALARRHVDARGPLVAFAVGGLALGTLLLAPRAFSDPVAVDPYDVRLAAAALVLLAAAYAVRRLRTARAVLLAIAAVTVPYCLWSALPEIVARLGGGRVSGPQQAFVAALGELLLTLVFVGMARFALEPGARPDVRLRSGGWFATVLASGGVTLLVLVSPAVPATILGRVGVAPVALARDLPWLGPANVLQAAAQEIQFRGLLLGALERSVPRMANLGQAVFFGLAHIAVQYEGPAGPIVVVTILLGVILGWATRRTGSLLPAIAVHGAADLLVAVAVLPGLYGQ